MDNHTTTAYLAHVFPDGRSRPASWAAIFVSDDGSTSVLRGYDAAASRHLIALQGALAVLSALPLDATCTVYTHSAYLARAINEWRPTWEQRNWRNSEGALVANFAEWQRLFRELDARPGVRLEWFRGTVPDPEHFMAARRIALEAAEAQRGTAHTAMGT